MKTKTLKRKTKGVILYGRKPSKSPKAIKGINFYVEIIHPDGDVDKTESVNYYQSSTSARRGARRMARNRKLKTFGYEVKLKPAKS